MAGKMC